MSDGSTHAAGQPGDLPASGEGQVEEVIDGQLVGEQALPVRRGAAAGALQLAGERSVPAALLPVVAAGSFVAGAALAGIMQRRRSGLPAAGGRALRARSQPGLQRGAERLQVLGSRSFLLDVHLLGGGR